VTDKAAPEGDRRLAPLRTLVPYVLRYKGHVIGALFALVAASGAMLVVPLAVRQVIDHGFDNADAGLVDRYFLALVGVVGWLAAASSLRYYLVTWLGERVVADVRRDVFAHVVRLSPAFFDTAQSGEVVSRLTADATQVKSAVGSSASIALRNIVLFLGATALMVVTSPRLSLFVLAAIPFIVLPIVFFGRSVRRRSRAAQDVLAEASAFAGEQIGAARTVQSFTNEAFTSRRFTGAVEAAFEAARVQVKARALLTAFAIFTIFASVVAVLWIGAQDVLANRLSAGALGQFVLYAVFAASALGELSQVWGEISQAAGAAERLAELLRLRSAVPDPARPAALPVPPPGTLAFRDVSFAYPSRPDVTVLRGVDLAVGSGETVAIVGPSGAGKSTLFALALRFYDPGAGQIFLDGVDLTALSPPDARARLALVPQDPVIFATNALENIRYGRPEASDEEVRRAAEAAFADRFITALPEGYATELGERGVTLSGGQRQRIAIARAILKDAPILLLDEATSALDAESETLVQAALERLKEGRTTLVIAHRLATIQNADRIVVMQDGEVVEEGSHAALVGNGGLYARLARLQFSPAA
jgi:ATP-binding cassette subfamily B protein